MRVTQLAFNSAWAEVTRAWARSGGRDQASCRRCLPV